MNSKKYLSQEERSQLETFLRARLEGDTLRDSSMLLTALYSGARAAELLALEWTDINLKSGEVFIRTKKSGRDRAIVIPGLIARALAGWRIQSPVRPFPVSYQRLAEIWRNWRPVAKPFHSLRHTFAMRCYERTKDIRFTQRALGHKSITNTMVYADYSYSSSEFKKMMRVK